MSNSVVIVPETTSVVEVTAPAESAVIVGATEVSEVVNNTTEHHIIYVPTGPQGPKGDAAVSFIVPAGQMLSGQRAVKVLNGQAWLCDGSNVSDAGRCVGITTGAAQSGANVIIQTRSVLIDPAFNFNAGPVYVGVNGLLTQALTGLVFLQQVGQAISQTQLDINPQLAIRLV